MYTTLIDASQLQALRASGQPLLVFDCSADLMNPAAGAQQYRERHIAGAVFADLDHDLSDKSGTRCRIRTSSPRGCARWVSATACRRWCMTARA
jgi:3-mercaptopyruvate sulfurtransferase SseA